MNCTSVTPQSIVVCRLCTKSHEYYVNIFISNESCEIMVEEAIQDLLGLPVAVGDGLPNVVCRLCMRKLIEFREFKNMCFASASELRAYAMGNDFLVSKIKDEEAADVETSKEGRNQENTFLSNIQVTEVYITMPDELAIGNVSHSKEELWSSENALVVKEEVTDGGNYAEGDVPVTALASVPVDPLAIDTMVDRCNNIGGQTEELDMGSEGLGADIQGISQNQVLGNPSCDPVHEENLQLEYSLANSFIVDCSPEKREKIQKKNIKLNASSNQFSQLNDSARFITNHECEQLCHEAENTSFPAEYICNYCSMKYSEKNSLALHIRMHLDGMSSASVLSKKDFQQRFSQNLLVKDQGHFESVIVEPFNISVLQKSSRPRNEKQAVEDSSGGENLGRTLCNTKKALFKNVKPREKALVMAHKCKECGKIFSKRANLTVHLRIHSGVKPFKCNECGKMFTQSGDLNRHSVVHTGVKRFKCNECGKMFNRSSNLRTHSRIHSGEKPFKCNECGKMFTTSGNLIKHSVVHTGVKRFKCNECGKIYTNKSTLKTHSLVHTGLKPFKCNKCGKMFVRRGDLKSHSLVHTGVKPFKCNECGKMFSTRRDISRHSVVHTGVKRFKCNECGKMFTQSGALKSHSVIHTGVKPFKCNECGKMFSRKVYLTEHSVVHSGVMPYKCDLCGEQFKRRVGFNCHLYTHAN